jgi:hypothetical protein
MAWAGGTLLWTPFSSNMFANKAGMASAVALSIGTVAGLRAVMVINVVTFAVAGWLVITFRGADTSEAADAGPAEPEQADPGGGRTDGCGG